MNMEHATFILKKTDDIPRERTIPLQKSVKDFLSDENVPSGKLFFDGSGRITRIGFEDPINLYFGGQENDIYRIEDSTSMRYRIVYNITDKIVPRDVKKTVAPLSPEEMLLRAKKTLGELYSDRRYTLNVSDEESLIFEGVHVNNQRRLFTVLVELEYMKKNIGHLLKSEMMVEVLSRIKERYPSLQEFDYEKIEQSCAEYAKWANIIVIFDNPAKVNLPVKLKHHHAFLQFFPIQQMQFNISRHVSQPKMTLLDRNENREEILELYRLNGEELCPDKTLGDYNLSPDTKLIII
jgi:hypothetical protein